MLGFSIKTVALSIGAAFLVGGIAAAQAQETTEYDNRSAVIFAYFGVGNDDTPAASITREQFEAQIEELTSGGYHVLPLLDIITAYKSGNPLPDRTVAITFDGADISVPNVAAPLLLEKQLPFTVFIPTGPVDEGKPPYMTWDDLKALKHSGLVTFGIHPSTYSRLTNDPEENIRRQLNNALTTVRKKLDVEPKLVAYPFGEYDAKYESIVKKMGFAAAFGQQSGVSYAGDDLYALPRFTLTERYGDIDRFVMTASALPLPVKDISPADPYLDTLMPVIGFTVPDSLASSVKKISCFSSSEEKPTLEFLNARVEIRMPRLDEDRARINCTMPFVGKPGEDMRYRWFGMMYTVPDELLEQEELPVSQKHAADYPDDILIE